MATNRGITSFWCLNHELKDEELRWQLDEIKDKGFGGVYVHPRDGLRTPYLSEHWFDRVATIVRHCHEVGLDVWLYDEDPFPSGAASGRVILDHPEYTARALQLESFDVQGGSIQVDFPVGRLIRVFALSITGCQGFGDYRDITRYVGTIRSTWNDSSIGHFNYYSPYLPSGDPHWRTEASGQTFRIACVLPEGVWKICAIVERMVPFGAWGGYADIMNPDAVQAFIDLTHEAYAERFEDHFGREIKGMFTDEPKLMGDFPWTPSLPNKFQEWMGYDLLEKLPHLWHWLDGNTAQIRHDYRYALGKLMNMSYTVPICDWCAAHGLISTGHMGPEEDPIGQTKSIPYLLSMLKEFRLPGTDHIANLIGSHDYPLLHLGPKLASSAAHLTGRNDVIVEAFGANSWHFGFKEMKKIVDWLFVTGVTEVTTHGQFYSVDGPRKREAPPSLFYQSSHWPFFGSFTGYMSEISTFMKQGRHRCQLLVYYPQATFSAYFPDRLEEMERLRDLLGDLLHQLLSQQLDFDLVDEASLLGMRIEDGKIVGNGRYDGLILPWCSYLEETVSRWCAKLVDEGGRVFALGAAPQIILSRHSTDFSAGEVDHLSWNLASSVTVETINDVLNQVIDRPFKLYKIDSGGMMKQNPKGIYVQIRESGNTISAFLVNALDEWFEGEFLFAGSSLSLKARVLLPPYGSMMIQQEADCVNVPCMPSTPSIAELEAMRTGDMEAIDVSENWQVEPHMDNVLLLSHWHFWDHDPGTEMITLVPAVNLIEQQSSSFASEGWGFCRFYSTGTPGATKLVFELSASDGICDIFVNGCQLPAPLSVRRYDVHNVEIDISPYIKQGMGMHTNLVSVRYSGGQMKEPFRLFGDFQVTLPYAGFPIGQVHYDRTLREKKQLRSWKEFGYPHYSGTMKYSQRVSLSGNDLDWSSLFLVVEELHDVATLYVNGTEAGTRFCAPFVWDITSWATVGSNLLTLLVANSPFPVFEGKDVNSGIIGAVNLIRLPRKSGGKDHEASL